MSNAIAVVTSKKVGSVESWPRGHEAFHAVAHPGERGIELPPSHGHAVDGEALLEADQVWRSVTARAVPGGRERLADHRRDGSLPVGAGDVDDGIRALWLAEIGREGR